MMKRAAVLLLMVPAPLFAQVKVTRILDTPETRVAQVEIPANDTRPLHSHPEALWHVFVTTDAPMELLIEGEPIVHLGPWQAHFFKGGTLHAGAVALDEKAARELAVALAISTRDRQTGR